MATITAERLLTAEEFWSSPANTQFSELVRGKVVTAMPPGGIRGKIQLILGAKLLAWSQAGVGGHAGVESGFLLARNPDVVRAPDVHYVRPERAPSDVPPAAFWQLAPDLAVEIVSPNQSAEEIRARVRDFLAAGTPLLWVVYPLTREVLVHLPDGSAKSHDTTDVLDGGEVLPGFRCPVSDLFDR